MSSGPDPKEVQHAKELCEDLLANVRDQYQRFKDNPPQRTYNNNYGDQRSSYNPYGSYGQQSPATPSAPPAPPGVSGASSPTDYSAQYAQYYGGQDPYAAYGGYQNYVNLYSQYYQQQQQGAPGAAPPGPPSEEPPPPPPPSGSPPANGGYNSASSLTTKRYLWRVEDRSLLTRDRFRLHLECDLRGELDISSRKALLGGSWNALSPFLRVQWLSFSKKTPLSSFGSTTPVIIACETHGLFNLPREKIELKSRSIPLSLHIS